VARLGSFAGSSAGPSVEASGGPAGGPGGLAAVPAAPPEPTQPVYTRYWLPGKGPAPAGNVPAAVHFTPTRVTLKPPAEGENGGDGGDGGDGEDGGNADGKAGDRVTLTVACGPSGAAGSVQLVVPAGLAVSVDGGPASASADPLPYRLSANEFASWDVTVSALPGTADGRYFLAARISDNLGQLLEDTALVTIGEPGAPDPDQEPDELFFRMQSDVEALAGEAGFQVLTPALTLAPGETGELAVKVTNHFGSQLRGEVQLVSPIGTWQGTSPWTQGVEAEPGAASTIRFAVMVPGTSEPGWHSWLLVKLMYFGRVRYSESVPVTVGPRPAS
jgi:alpha-mannosidase